VTNNAAQTAAGRLFRVYERHCQEPGRDTLFEVLTAVHSLNDRLKKTTGRDLHEIEEFIALKVLRNFAHHEEEVLANVRVIPVPAYSDLLGMCIVRRDQVERAIENVKEKWRDGSRTACEAQFHWYGEAVNINPCLFNLVVRIYELLLTITVFPPEEDVASMQASYEFEEAEGHSHYVDGRLTANVAELDAVLSQVVAELPGV
jgi:hypothetical protein